MLHRTAPFAFLIFSLALLGLPLRAAESAKPQTCGQTNECLWIAGTIRIEPQPPFNTRVPARTNRFEALTDGLLWRIKMFPVDEATRLSFAYFEAGTDGESVYRISAFNTNDVRGEPLVWPNGIVVTNRGPWTSRTVAGGVVSEGVIPPQSGSQVEIIWAAWLSGCVLKDQDKDSVFELPPLYGGDEGSFNRVTEPVRWTLSAKFPFVPSLLAFYGAHDYGFGGSPEPKPMRIKPDSPYTNWMMQVQSVTNLGAWTVPATCTFGYYMQPAQPGGPARLSTTGTGTTTRVERRPWTTNFLPAVPGMAHVTDWRIHSKGPVTYYVSNQWFSVEQVMRNRRQ